MRTALRLALVSIVLVAASFSSPPASATSLQAAAPAQEKPQVFRAGIEVVSLNVTVTDAQGRYITDITQDEFNVFEIGRAP
jgi:hypothetical protein